MKIQYGIDLGTTNSAIAKIDKGEPIICKTDQFKEIMPSCVGFNKKGSIIVGDGALKSFRSDKLKAVTKDLEPNFFIEFKRTMGTDTTYYSSHKDQSFNSEELSAEVLKKLKSFLEDNPQAAVITVPAQFDIGQKDATFRAAKLAGFQHCELLQEPIAASTAFGMDSESKNGFWVVFDFGGGTFDAALVKVEEGVMNVVDMDGDNHLGGKNLDLAIVDEVILPYLQENYSFDSLTHDEAKRKTFREALKPVAEELKNQLSFEESYSIYIDPGDYGEDDDGEEFDIDLSLSREQLKEIIAPVFQKAIDTTKSLLERNNLNGDQLDTIILVGGPTHSPILRNMLTEQIKEPDTSVDPMTAVAKGAALYASTVDVSEEIKEASRDRTKIQLDIGYEASSVETEEWVTIKVLKDKTEGDIPNQIFAELIRQADGWKSGQVEINEKGEILEAQLRENKSNSFQVAVYDEAGNQLEAEPQEFNILQGFTGHDQAVLPHNIGVEIKRQQDERLIFKPVKGLEKNQQLPANGNITNLKTQKQIRPGKSEDFIKVPIYQGEYGAEGTRAIYNEHVYDVKITGDDLPGLLPEGSDVNLYLKSDKSGRIAQVEAYFPYIDHTSEIPIPEQPGAQIESEFLDNEFRKAKGSLQELRNNGHADEKEIADLEKSIESYEQQFNQARNDDDQKQEVLKNLRTSLRKIDELQESTAWPTLKQKLTEEFERLEKANNKIGDEKTTKQVEQFRTQLDDVMRQEDTSRGQTLLNEIHEFYIQLTFIYQLIGVAREARDHFDEFRWEDSQRARQLVNQADQIIADNPTKERLHPVVAELIRLMPREEQPAGDDSVLQM